MPVIGVKAGNQELLLEAFEHLPCLVIDCSNSANPHALFPRLPLEKFGSIYIIEVELLYKFRDVLRQLPKTVKELEISSIAITSRRHLFAYDNEEENQDITEHCWELIKELGKSCKVFIAASKEEEKHCDTIWAILSGAKGSSWK